MRENAFLNEQTGLSPGFHVKNTIDAKGAVFTVFKGEIPLVLCLLATDPVDDLHWKLVEDVYLKTTDQMPIDWAEPQKPPSTPWLAVVLLGLQFAPEAVGWLGDFERCLAWTIIDHIYS